MTEEQREAAKLSAKAAQIRKEQGKNSNYVPEQELDIVKEIIGFALYIGFIVLAVWGILTFVGHRTEVSGDSMYSTLEDGDSLWLDSLTYRFRAPKRFEIVVFPYEGSTVSYIKRVIGLPGEKVRIDQDGTIYINGSPLEENYGYETIMPNMIGRASQDIVLGEDEYFVLGDNRNDSKDSRFDDVGNIHRDQMEGRAVFRIWPLNRFGTIK